MVITEATELTFSLIIGVLLTIQREITGHKEEIQTLTQAEEVRRTVGYTVITMVLTREVLYLTRKQTTHC